MNAKDFYVLQWEVRCTAAGQTALLWWGSTAAFPFCRAFPDLWPWGAEVNFCHTIDHCRTILYCFVLYCRLFTLLLEPGGLTGSQILTKGLVKLLCKEL